jgi:hypothetical protein
MIRAMGHTCKQLIGHNLPDFSLFMELLEIAFKTVNGLTVGRWSGFFLSMLLIMLLLHQEPTQQSQLRETTVILA